MNTTIISSAGGYVQYRLNYQSEKTTVEIMSLNMEKNDYEVESIHNFPCPSHAWKFVGFNLDWSMPDIRIFLTISDLIEHLKTK